MLKQQQKLESKRSKRNYKTSAFDQLSGGFLRPFEKLASTSMDIANYASRGALGDYTMPNDQSLMSSYNMPYDSLTGLQKAARTTGEIAGEVSQFIPALKATKAIGAGKLLTESLVKKAAKKRAAGELAEKTLAKRLTTYKASTAIGRALDEGIASSAIGLMQSGGDPITGATYGVLGAGGEFAISAAKPLLKKGKPVIDKFKEFFKKRTVGSSKNLSNDEILTKFADPTVEEKITEDSLDDLIKFFESVKNKKIEPEIKYSDEDIALAEIIRDLRSASTGKKYFNEGELINAEKSTFPDWLPEYSKEAGSSMRDSKLIKKVTDHILSGAENKPKNKREIDLYDLIMERAGFEEYQDKGLTAKTALKPNMEATAGSIQVTRPLEQAQSDKLYHGTNKEFDKFKLSEGIKTDAYGKGIYLTNSKEKAGRYGRNIIDTTIPENLNILDIYDRSKILNDADYSKIIDKLNEAGIKAIYEDGWIKTSIGNVDTFDRPAGDIVMSINRHLRKSKDTSTIGRIVNSIGYDGLTTKGQSKKDFTTVIYNPENVSINTPPQQMKPLAQESKRTALEGLQDVTESTEQHQLRTKLATPETVAQKLMGQSKVFDQAESLGQTISKGNIDVKKKVNLLDYIRTPDRVLKKIGLEKEAGLLRRQYDKYIKELPQEIDKVTAWSKRVSKIGNAKIFNYLDGDTTINLTPEEMQVASEVKAYLKEWAEKLKLPEDKRISHYITHIFEPDFIQKEFDQDLANIIKDKVPGSVYDPFLEERLGKKGYIEDTWRALDAYVKRATRKYNMDVALKPLAKKAEGLEQSQYDYVKKYIDRVNLRPTKLDNLVDNTIKSVIGYKLGQRPVTSLTRTARQMIYRGALGLNVGSAVKNLTQGVNTYAKLGEKYTIKGYYDLLTKGTKELIENGALGQDIIQDRALSSTRKFWEKFDRKLFYLFDSVEKINRGAAYYGGKSKALAMGMSENEAIEYAKKLVRDTQFTFGSIDTPVALQSDIAKLLAQFQTYTLKQGEFLAEMAHTKDYAGLMRYSLGSLAIAATIGKAIGMEWKDFIPMLRFGAPPAIKAPLEIGKTIIGARDKWGNIPSMEQRGRSISNALVPYVPAGVQSKKTYEGLRDTIQGYSESPSGRIRYVLPYTMGTKIQGGIFGTYATPQAKEYHNKERSVLGAKQSDTIKALKDKAAAYNRIMSKRESKETLNIAAENAIMELKEMRKNNPELAAKAIESLDNNKPLLHAIKAKLKGKNLSVKIMTQDMFGRNDNERAVNIYKEMQGLDRDGKKNLITSLIKTGAINDDISNMLVQIIKIKQSEATK